MKKVVGVILILLLAHSVFSQNHFGVKAGGSWAWQTLPSSVSPNFPSGYKPNTKGLAGYEVGLFYNIPVAEHWQLSTEANLSLRGVKSKIFVLTDSVPLLEKIDKIYVTTKAYYLYIPILLTYKIQRFTAGAGPSAGILLYSRTTFFKSKFPSGFKTFDAGANLLAGYQLARKWGVNLQYYHGLTALYHGKGGDVHNRSASLNVLYILK